MCRYVLKKSVRGVSQSVSSAFRVSVNSVLVGEATGTRTPREFDITHAILAQPSSEHEICVEVFQWSHASILEDNDNWWHAGIHRHIYVTARPRPVWIQDFDAVPHATEFRTCSDGMCETSVCNGTLVVDVTLATSPLPDPPKDYIVSVDLELQTVGRVVRLHVQQPCSTASWSASHPCDKGAPPSWVWTGTLPFNTLPPFSVLTWTPASPVVHRLHVSLATTKQLALGDAESPTEPTVVQVEATDIGFRKVCVKRSPRGRQFVEINDERVVFRGINYHEHDMWLGSTVRVPCPDRTTRDNCPSRLSVPIPGHNTASASGSCCNEGVSFQLNPLQSLPTPPSPVHVV